MKSLGLAVVAVGGLLALVVLPRADTRPDMDDTAQVFVVNEDGSGLRRLTSGGRSKTHLTWSPDGRRLAYADGTLHVLTLAAARDRVIRRTRHNPAHQTLAWSPRRQELLYGFRTGRDDLTRASLATLSADGSRFRRLTSWRQDGFPLGAPVWSPDGERIAYPRQGGVAILGRRGGGRHTTSLRGDEDEPRWSPAGRSILLVREAARSGQELWTTSARGGSPRRVGPKLVAARFPSWSRDGARVAFTGHTDTGARQQAVYVMAARRGAVPRMAAPEAAESAWSPTDELIAFADFNGNLRVTAPDGSAQRTLATFPQDTDFRHLAWSPDGRRLAFTAEKRPPSG